MSNRTRRRGLIAAVALLVVLLGGGALLLVLQPSDPASPGAQPPVGGTATTSAPMPPSGAPGMTAQPLTQPPAGVQWELFQGVALPTSTVDGPTRVDGPVHAGFSRTPTGALLADAQISYRSLVTPDLRDLRIVGQQQLAEGPGRTAYLNLIGGLKENDPPAGGYAQIVGFKYVAFSPDLAVISLASRGKSGRIQVGTDTLRWIDGDWKVELPASGLQQPQAVADLTGYVLWSGVSS